MPGKRDLDLFSQLLDAFTSVREHRRTDPSFAANMNTLIDPHRKLYGRMVVDGAGASIAVAANGGLYRRQGATFAPVGVRDLMAFDPSVSQRVVAGIRSA